MSRKLLGLEIAAWSAGVLCSAALLLFHVEGSRAEQIARRLGHSPAPAAAQASETEARHDEDLSTFNGVIGRLEMPALGLSVPILNDYDPDSLRKGVGRVKGTAVPGGLGNFVVAGHRDTYFRPLRRVSPGMTMHVVTGEGSFDYIVDNTTIVQPSDLDVLDIGERPEMTLITCYPFNYVGAAPKRFVVRAHLVSVSATQ